MSCLMAFKIFFGPNSPMFQKSWKKEYGENWRMQHVWLLKQTQKTIKL